jgi:hypothetical protein
LDNRLKTIFLIQNKIYILLNGKNAVKKNKAVKGAGVLGEL